MGSEANRHLFRILKAIKKNKKVLEELDKKIKWLQENPILFNEAKKKFPRFPLQNIFKEKSLKEYA